MARCESNGSAAARFILGSSFLVFASLLEVVVTTYFAENDQPETGRLINGRMRIIAPAVFVVIALLSLTR